MPMDFSAAGLNGLLNQKSKTNMKITMVAYEDIVRNEKNHYSIEDIERLAISIGDVGLREPLEVKALEDGSYMLIGGERRYTAIGMLREQGDTRYDLVPCVVVDMDAVDLPLSDELKELYVLTTTNAEQRAKSDYDLMQQVQNLSLIYSELKAAGHTLKGRQRDLIADKLGISATQVQRYTNIGQNLSPELQADFKEGKMAMTVADSAAKLPPEKQAALKAMTEQKDEITQKDVDQMAAAPLDQDADDAQVSDGLEAEVVVDTEVLETLEERMHGLREDLSEGGVFMTAAEKEKLVAAVAKAEKALIRALAIIEKAI